MKKFRAILIITSLFSVIANSYADDTVITANARVTNNNDYDNVTVNINNDINITSGTVNEGSEGLLNFENITSSYSGQFIVNVNADINYAPDNTTVGGAILNLNNFGNDQNEDLELILNVAGGSTIQSDTDQPLIYVNAKEGGRFNTTINLNSSDENLDSAELLSGQYYSGNRDNVIEVIHNDDDYSSSVTINAGKVTPDFENNVSILSTEPEEGIIYIKNGGDHVINLATALDSGILDNNAINVQYQSDSNSAVTINNAESDENNRFIQGKINIENGDGHVINNKGEMYSNIFFQNSDNVTINNIEGNDEIELNDVDANPSEDGIKGGNAEAIYIAGGAGHNINNADEINYGGSDENNQVTDTTPTGLIGVKFEDVANSNINNSAEGQIWATADAGGKSVYVVNSEQVTVENEGIIYGATAIDVENSVGDDITINNAEDALIEGITNSAIEAEGGDDVVIVNNGVIRASGNNSVIKLTDVANVEFNNSGDIIAEFGPAIEIAETAQGNAESFTLTINNESNININNANSVRSQASANNLNINIDLNATFLAVNIALLGNAEENNDYQENWSEVRIGDNRTLTIADNESVIINGGISVNGSNLETDSILVNNGTISIADGGSFSLVSADNFTNNGNLINNGSIDLGGTDINISQGNTLSGSGVFTSSVIVQNGATFSPGNSIGNPTFESDLTLEDGSTSIFEYNSVETDTVTVDENVILNGTLNINRDTSSDFSLQNAVLSSNLIESEGTITGQFDEVNYDISDDYIYGLIYNSQSTTLTIADKLDENILDSRLLLSNNILRVTNRQNNNEFLKFYKNRKNNLNSEKYHSWFNFENINYDRNSVADSSSFDTDGVVLSAGIVVSELDFNILSDVDFGFSIFKSDSDIIRSSYDGSDQADVTGINLNLAKNFATKYGDFYSILGVSFAGISFDSNRNVVVNGDAQNATSTQDGSYYAISLATNYQKPIFNGAKNNKTILDFAVISSLQNVTNDAYEEQGLTGGNFSVGEFDSTTFNLELSSTIRHKLDKIRAKYLTIIPQDTIIEAGFSLYNSINFSDAESDISFVGSDIFQKLSSDYSQSPIIGLSFGVDSPIKEDLSLKARYEVRNSSEISDTNLMVGINWNF